VNCDVSNEPPRFVRCRSSRNWPLLKLHWPDNLSIPNGLLGEGERCAVGGPSPFEAIDTRGMYTLRLVDAAGSQRILAGDIQLLS
jgi:hypothetical protein